MPKHSVQPPWTLILKLRGNIQLEGDLQLAELEVAKLLGSQPEPLDKSGMEALAADGTMCAEDVTHCRANGVVGYRVRVEQVDVGRLFRRLSFVELVVGTAPVSSGLSRSLVHELGVPSAFIRLQDSADTCRFRMVPLNTVAEWSDIVAKRAGCASDAVKALEQTLGLALEGKSPGRGCALSERAMSAKLTTGHLFHGLHVYKAKFFPRMVRALLNVYAPYADACVLDPYVGSGTALTEACVMGMPSAGVDIDPLSALIASTKIKLTHGLEGSLLNHVLELRGQLERLETGQLSLFRVAEPQAAYGMIPSFLTRRIPSETREEVANDISLALRAIQVNPNCCGAPLRVALSDAISRKFKFRFLGLGYGRFSLNIMPGRILEMFRRNLDYLAKSIGVWQWLREAANLTPAPSAVELGDARALPFSPETFDMVVTSPPYLPASSGRENYLKSKALAMTALNLIGPDDVDAYERTQVGSVHRTHDDLTALPQKAREVVEWMASDEVRQVKAAATGSYFVDLAQSLREIRRVLRPGGCCAMVIARQHTFYRYKSREVVRIIDNAGTISELAAFCGLDTEHTLHIELNKQNTVARPRSLDAYYESILVLRRP